METTPAMPVKPVTIAAAAIQAAIVGYVVRQKPRLKPKIVVPFIAPPLKIEVLPNAGLLQRGVQGAAVQVLITVIAGNIPKTKQHKYEKAIALTGSNYLFLRISKESS